MSTTLLTVDTDRLRALMEILVNRAKGDRAEQRYYLGQGRVETAASFGGSYTATLNAVDEIGGLLTPRMCVEVSDDDMIIREYTG